MLALARGEGQSIIIDGNIEVKIVKWSRSSVRLAIQAPREVSVDRDEIWRKMHPGQLTPLEKAEIERRERFAREGGVLPPPAHGSAPAAAPSGPIPGDGAPPADRCGPGLCCPFCFHRRPRRRDLLRLRRSWWQSLCLHRQHGRRGQRRRFHPQRRTGNRRARGRPGHHHRPSRPQRPRRVRRPADRAYRPRFLSFHAPSTGPVESRTAHRPARRAESAAERRKRDL